MKIQKTGFLNNIFLFIALLFLATPTIVKILEERESDIQKNKAITVLKAELVNNQNILNSWKKWDNQIMEQLDTLIYKTRVDESYIGRLPVPLQVAGKRYIAANQSISALDESAWLALKNSEVIKKFDFEALYKLESVYGSQRFLVDLYLDVPEVNYSSPNDRNYSDEDALFLLKLRQTFSQLQLAEQQLGYHYDHIFRLTEFSTEQD